MTEYQANKIDQILSYLIERDPKFGTNLYEDEISDVVEITPDEAHGLICNILKYITFHENPVAEIMIDSTSPRMTRLKLSYNTTRFMEFGGCIKIYRDQIIEKEKQADIEQLERLKLENDIASFKITKNQYRWNKWIAISGFLLALFSLLLQIFNKPN